MLAPEGAASLPAVPERPLPTTPGVGPLSSESTVHTLHRLRLYLTSAQTVFLIDQSNLPLQAEGWQLNRLTTRPCSQIQIQLYSATLAEMRLNRT